MKNVKTIIDDNTKKSEIKIDFMTMSQQLSN